MQYDAELVFHFLSETQNWFIVISQVYASVFFNPELSQILTSLFADNIKSEEDLRQFVQQQYEERSDTEVGMMTTVQSLVSVTQHYMATLDSSCPQVCARKAVLLIHQSE